MKTGLVKLRKASQLQNNEKSWITTQTTRHSGRDCRNPVAMDGTVVLWPSVAIPGPGFPPVRGENDEQAE